MNILTRIELFSVRKTEFLTLFDVACPFKTKVVHKEGGKIENYTKLMYAIKRIWNFQKAETVKIVIRTLK